MFSALTETLREGLRPSVESKDLLTGTSVGVIALPFSMALATASGMAPRHGLYTASVAGIVEALSGGSPVNVTGLLNPTNESGAVMRPPIFQ